MAAGRADWGWKEPKISGKKKVRGEADFVGK
ncbi:hypothetical protein V512_014970 [Mesotoga sp. Brook.08.105.5.1]|nr:hypothetical protein V512_014970 [Mesotoga sp. Brook.08.105.5.1]RAO96503.1 hypothetical protein M388_13965 [Mesotoga sp. Brook.08.YT.4.2.5.4.]